MAAPALDAPYLAQLERHAQHRAELVQLTGDLVQAQDWLGPDGRGPRIRLRLDRDRIHERETGKRGRARQEIRFSKRELKHIAAQPEVLVPIRLEFEHDAYKLRDTFTWNLRETVLTPEMFASHLVEDLRLPHIPFYKEVATQIRRQLEDARVTAAYDAHLALSLDPVREANRSWFENRAKRRRLGTEGTSEGLVQDAEDEELAPASSLDDVTTDELRVVIRLDITLESVQLVDRFEWDMSDPTNSPEAFAEVFAADLGLAGEFRTAIAHSIREQVDVFVRSLYLLGHVSGLHVMDDDLRREFLPSLFQPFRSDVTEFTPLLHQLTPDEVERNEKERDREVRRKRRQTKGRGITLPDRDAVKTQRTLVPIPSTRPLVPVTDAEDNIHYPLAEVSRPYPIVGPVMPPKPPVVDVLLLSPVKLPVAVPGEALKPVIGRAKKPLANGESSASIPGTPGSATRPKNRRLEDGTEIGLQPNIVDGRWHCANCGMPESCTDGKRKGLSGPETLCVPCGQHFSRNRRNRAVPYTTDLAYHLAHRSISTGSRQATKPPAGVARSSRAPPAKGGPRTRKSSNNASLADYSGESSDGGDSDEDVVDSEDSESSEGSGSVRARPQTRGARTRGSPDLPFVQLGSPDSDMSSLVATPPPPPVVLPPRTTRISNSQQQQPLPWMLAAAAELRAQQVDDLFDIIPRSKGSDPDVPVEWRVRCLDCPGKLYNLGPGETLENFSVHFKNRHHRALVTARVAGG